MPDPAGPPQVSAVVLAYGPAPLLRECVTALLASAGVAVEVLLVDNGSDVTVIGDLEGLPGVAVLRPGTNTGFAGGCNLAARQAAGDHLVLVNADAVVGPTALEHLTAALQDPGVGLASASLRLRSSPATVNSAGNPVHYLGLSWAGGLGDPASAHAGPVDVASASGAALALRRCVWERLGGFWEEMFAYCEDAELSLRCWQAGLRVVYVPDAVVLHDYEFSRNPSKMYLLERNRLLLLLTLYERRTLLLLSPALLALELAVLLLSVRQRWAGQKASGWWWLLRHRDVVRRRRREVQRARTVGDREVAGVLTAELTPAAETGFRVPPAVNALSRLYWSLVRPRLGCPAAGPPGADRPRTCRPVSATPPPRS